MAVYDFAPSTQAPFQFQPRLDGRAYNAFVTWNLFGRRFYLEIYAVDGTRILTAPLVGSPTDYDVSLVAGYFDSTLVFREASQQIVVLP